MPFDALRRQHPDLGFAVYGIDPDGPVTLETHALGAVSTVEGASLAACIDKAFPPKPKPKNELTPMADVTWHEAAALDLTIPDFLVRTAPKTPPDSVFD